MKKASKVTVLKHKKTKLVSPKRAAKIKSHQKKKVIKKQVRQSLPKHKRFALHPVTVMIFLAITVLVVGWTYKVAADSYTVNATVPAPILDIGATIVSPSNNSTLTTSPVMVSGVCPSGSYVNVFVNNSFAGTALCAGNNTFSVEVSIYPGTNNINAQDYNILNVAGPKTPTTTITYNPPAVPSQSASSGTGSTPTISPAVLSAAAAAPPISLTSSFQYQTFTTDNKFTWPLDLEGGVPPYKVHIVWGDGQTSDLVFKTDPVFYINHVYKTNGYYAIKVFSSDSDNQTHMVQLAALIKQPGSSSIFSANGQGGSSAGNSNGTQFVPPPPQGGTGSISSTLYVSRNWLWVAWPSIGVVALMMFSFYLGEKEIYRDVSNLKFQKVTTKLQPRKRMKRA